MPIYTDYSILNQKTFSKYGLIIGPGGHGFGSFTALINNPDIEFSIVMTPMDDGGCTGRMQKYFKAAIQNINTYDIANFNKGKNPIALGDLKNNIKVWLTNYLENEMESKIIEQAFECRSTCAVDLKNNFYKLAQVFPFLKKYWTSFCLLSESYLDVLSKSQEAGEKTSFGNLLLQLLYNQNANAREFFNELKVNGITPKNVNLHFLVDQQLTLRGVTESGKALNSEAELDVYQSDPVKIESYKLYDSNNQELTIEKIFSLNPELSGLFREIKHIKKQDVIILFPPGSISNLFPTLNILSDLIRSLNLPVLWFTNAFIQGNEQRLETQIQKMHQMLSGIGSPLVVLGASQNPFDFVDAQSRPGLESAYLQEDKTQVDQHAVARMMIDCNTSTIYSPSLDMTKIGGAGLKYRTEQIEEIVVAVMKIWDKIAEKYSDPGERLKRFVNIMKAKIPEEYRISIYQELCSTQELKLKTRDMQTLKTLR